MHLESNHILKFHATPPVKLRRHVKLQEKELGCIIWSDCTFKQRCLQASTNLLICSVLILIFLIYKVTQQCQKDKCSNE